MSEGDELWLWMEGFTGDDWDWVNFEGVDQRVGLADDGILAEVGFGEIWWYGVLVGSGEVEARVLVVMGRWCTTMN
jgi:hypothetical protein